MAGSRFTYPGGMEGWVDLHGWYSIWGPRKEIGRERWRCLNERRDDREGGWGTKEAICIHERDSKWKICRSFRLLGVLPQSPTAAPVPQTHWTLPSTSAACRRHWLDTLLFAQQSTKGIILPYYGQRKLEINLITTHLCEVVIIRGIRQLKHLFLCRW